MYINIFNSHRWRQDDSEVEKLRDWLRSDPYYNFRFYDVSRSDHNEGNGISTYLKQSIRDRIDKSTIVITFNNQSISYNEKSVHFYEILYAKSKNKPILLIDKWGTNTTPSIYKDYGNLFRAKWNSDSIREAIKRAK